MKLEFTKDEIKEVEKMAHSAVDTLNDSVLKSEDHPKTKYSQKEVEALTENELAKLISEPGWVIKGKEIVKLSSEEFAKVEFDYKDRGNAYRDDVF